MEKNIDERPVFLAGRSIPYRYVNECYYPYGNTPMDVFLQWKGEERRHVLSPSILALGCGIDIRLEGIGNRARAPYISIERTPGSC